MTDEQKQKYKITNEQKQKYRKNLTDEQKQKYKDSTDIRCLLGQTGSGFSNILTT